MADRVDAVMQTGFLTLRPETPIREAVAALVRGDTIAAPVVDDTGTLIGILTQRDCFRSALNASYYRQWSGTVADHHTTAVATLDAGTDLVSAAQAFLDAPYRAYPVVSGGRLVGMLSRADLLSAFLDLG